MNLLIAVTQTVFFIPAGLFAQVEYSYSSQGQAPGPLFWICDIAVTVLIVVAMWKNIQQSRSARLGRNHPDL
jgi:uncharacterized membrane protein